MITPRWASRPPRENRAYATRGIRLYHWSVYSTPKEFHAKWPEGPNAQQWYSHPTSVTVRVIRSACLPLQRLIPPLISEKNKYRKRDIDASGLRYWHSRYSRTDGHSRLGLRSFQSRRTDLHFRVARLTYILEPSRSTCLIWWTDGHAWFDGLRDMPDLMDRQTCRIIWSDGHAWFEEPTDMPDLIPTLLFPSNIHQNGTSMRLFFMFTFMDMI